MHQIGPHDLAERLGDDSRAAPLLLDVREPWEFQFCHIEGSVEMPMGSVPERHAELDRDREVVVICHHGGRSAQVCMFLEHQGFTNVINLAGGVAGWAAQVDPRMPRY
ncbi:rhodanese-like domain-containing protein [Thauera linaloolentis]|uniref:Rhodanese n=1 Tax=Thauera linaloolentis (strain DSM 12138 / JCM 21573 / CCUG 41526 / CIP 105981 / IAM 15112 / NBRC 102519 / 47Lol) TaxID=1123367 RepID=N6Z5T6_THAL4|nr:rhodanese-like domain-containing protein [Thauera linaloolentis]ENO89768.1 rhodanese [Thauera linaloolentis 47Lol = DSM 12138]MCM8566066.1 rhodanese-like domain-containing protein [Thauera linaloolentis]